MTIEFTNATPAKNNNSLSTALLVLSCLFFFIPVTLIVLGYYSSLPTGTLVSPIPQGVLSNSPSQVVSQVPVVASPETKEASSTATTLSNASQKTATLNPNQTENVVIDTDILETSQIYLLNKDGDNSLYTVKTKSAGQFTLVTTTPSESIRSIDYQIVNP